MSKKKRDTKKERRSGSRSLDSNPSFLQQLSNTWAEKKPVLLFLGGFGLLMSAFYAFWFSEVFKVKILAPVVRVNAWVGSKVLNVFGFGTQTTNTDIFSSTFSISVKQGCDAIEPIAIFTFAILLFPVSFRTKAFGLLAGVPLLWVLNQIRIISLFMFGLYSPTLFEIMHVQVWQALFIAITLATLLYWIVWALRSDKVTGLTTLANPISTTANTPS
jgi:exosortase/archaeosortase family protein